jgi:hypothetical protein
MKCNCGGEARKILDRFFEVHFRNGINTSEVYLWQCTTCKTVFPTGRSIRELKEAREEEEELSDIANDLNN